MERAEGRANRNFVEARSIVSPQTKACWSEIAGGYLLFDGPDSPLTQSFGLGLSQEVNADQLLEIESFFQTRNAPVMLELSPLISPEFVAMLNTRGYQPIEFSSVMYLPLNLETLANLPSRAVSGAPHLEVRTVKDDEFDSWANLSADGWSEHPEFTTFIRELALVFASAKGVVAMQAELNGQPIASGAMYLEDGIAILAGASTIPSARNQGAQSALLAARLHHAHTAGCKLATMAARPGSPSQRNAQRNGFQIAYTRIKWCKSA